MKLSNKLLLSATGVLCILMIALTITARVEFDRVIKAPGVRYSNTYDYKP
jgi:hypothetical protein